MANNGIPTLLQLTQNVVFLSDFRINSFSFHIKIQGLNEYVYIWQNIRGHIFLIITKINLKNNLKNSKGAHP